LLRVLVELRLLRLLDGLRLRVHRRLGDTEDEQDGGEEAEALSEKHTPGLEEGVSELDLVAVVALRRHGVGPLGGQGVEGACAEEHDDDDHLPQGFGHFHRHLEDFRKRISDLLKKNGNLKKDFSINLFTQKTESHECSTW